MAFGFLKRLFGGGEAPAKPQAPAPAAKPAAVAAAPAPRTAAPAQPSPAPSAQPAANALQPAADTVPGTPNETMLQREIVLDLQLGIIGYNFRLRDSVLKRKDRTAHSVWKLYDEVLLRNFLADEATKTFGQKRIFLDISVWSLDSPLLSKLPKGRFVLMLRFDPAFFKNAQEHVALFQALKAQGFQIGFDNFDITPELMPLFAMADYHKLSVAEKDVSDLSKSVAIIAHAAPDAEILVGDIHFFEELQACRQLQVQYLQGGYLRHKELADADTVDPSYLRLMDVLNLVRIEADPAVIASAMKYDPMLTFKLLRYVNSPAAGLLKKVDSLERALILLGHKQLYRWLTLLVFSHDRQDGSHSVLLETALIRARMMETLGARQFKREELDQAFTVGMFSMLDALLRQPMASILEKLSLPSEINEALAKRQGRYGPLLSLTLACEDGELPEDPRLFAAAGVNKGEANKAQIEALLWVEEVV